jgi:hypothetical protein
MQISYFSELANSVLQPNIPLALSTLSNISPLYQKVDKEE